MRVSLLFGENWKAYQLVLIGLIFTCLAWGEYNDFISDALDHYIKKKYGTRAEKRILSWQNLIKNNQQNSDWEKLNLVNNFFDRIPYVTDLEHWGQYDYWATPIEMLATNGGDCEDYAIGKYFTLRALGVATEKMRITYVILTDMNQPHMVLAYYKTPDAEPLILDNIKKQIILASGRPDLQPVYGFNGDGLWEKHERGNELKEDNKRVFPWQDLNERMVSEMNKYADTATVTAAGN